MIRSYQTRLTTEHAGHTGPGGRPPSADGGGGSDRPTVLPGHTQGDETPTDHDLGMAELRAEAPEARIAAVADAVSVARGAWQDAMTARDRAVARFTTTLAGPGAARAR